jgi:formylglycine-generating enzyme required for sulfatase activity
MSNPCCSPGSPKRPGVAATDLPADGSAAPGDGAGIVGGGLVNLSGGAFMMGTDGRYGYPADGEGPAHEVVLSPFRIARDAVKNEQFSRFVTATGHRTEAESFGWSFVFAGFLPEDFPPTHAVAAAPWWRQVEGADWAHPEGPESSWEGRANHPVVHVSWNDAQAFCAWSGTRLPSEAEWEYAARGGSAGNRFPWGEELEPGGEHQMNVFQGTFPDENTCADGYAGTAPVGSFPANGFGLHDATGNVWEWTADWFDPGYYARSPGENPPGPETGELRVMRGGSYLCHASYCNRYRVDSRSGNSPDASTGNLSFRVARDV